MRTIFTSCPLKGPGAAGADLAGAAGLAGVCAQLGPLKRTAAVIANRAKLEPDTLPTLAILLRMFVS